MRKKFIYIIIIVILFCTVQDVCAASGYNYISIRYDNNVAADCIKPNRVLEISVNDFREYNDEIFHTSHSMIRMMSWLRLIQLKQKYLRSCR